MLASHDGRRAAYCQNGTNIVDIELMLEIFASNLSHARESGCLAGRVEQTIETAELEHRLPNQACETLIVANVQFDANGAGWVCCSDLSRNRIRGRAVEVSHHDVRAFLREAPSGSPPDTAPGADHDRDVAGE